MDSKLLFAIATLTGTIIGVGVFSIPYVMFKIGFLPGIFYLLILTVITILLHLIYGEIILRTKAICRLPGYAKNYLGEAGGNFASISTFISTPFTLICYIIAGGEFLSNILNGPIFICSLLVWIILSLGLILGITPISKIELSISLLMLLIIGVIFLVSLPKINSENFSGFSPENFFLPYGVILFALAGAPAIPTLRYILRGREKDLKKAIIIGTLIPAFFYAIFSFAVIGVSGNQTSEEAISGLVGKLGNNIILLGLLFGLMAILTSFLTFGIYLRDVLILDFKMKKTLATVLVMAISLVGVFLNKEYLILLIGFIGVIMGAFEDFILLLISRKAEVKFDRNPEWKINIPDPVIWLFCLVFIGGLIYEILFFLKK